MQHRPIFSSIFTSLSTSLSTSLFLSTFFSLLTACVAPVDDGTGADAETETDADLPTEATEQGLARDYGWNTIYASSPGTGVQTWGRMEDPITYRLYTMRQNGVEQAFPYVQGSSYTPKPATWVLFAYYWANCADGSQPYLVASYEGPNPSMYPTAVPCPRYVRMDSAGVMLRIIAK